MICRLKTTYFRTIIPNLLTVTIAPAHLTGTITAPASKSIAQRAFACAYIRKGKTTIHNTGTSDDELALLDVLAAAGCTITREGSAIVIDSTDAAWHTIANVSFRESGLAARMMMPVFSLQGKEITYTGTGSLLTRPIGFLTDTLNALGVGVSYAKGTLPVTMKGPLQPKSIEVDGSISSQAITGLILAYAAAGADDVTISVNNPVSTPYLSLTLKVMEEMGLPVPRAADDFTAFHFTKKTIRDTPIVYNVEGDWSAAAMMMVAGAIAGRVRITGLDVFTEQGDKAVLQALMDAGVRLSITADYIDVARTPLKAFHFDATDTPDLFPPLAVLAACASGTSVIEGVHRLKDKESNRAIALQEELGKLGVVISFQEDMMLIKGGALLTGAATGGRGDHRIVMACSIAGLAASGDTTIMGANAVNKSYPRFFEDLSSLGAQIIRA
jgi:3-phosphoshikimate 1-carboxyvinyltransferase